MDAPQIKDGTFLVSADAVVDPLKPDPRADAVLFRRSSEGVRVLAVGANADLARHEASPHAERIDAIGSVVVPAFVNAHTHLDLTHIGPRSFDHETHTFTSWLDGIRAQRSFDSDDVGASVEAGIERSISGGVIAMGDISGADHARTLEALRASDLLGVSFAEFFGLADRQAASIERMHDLVNSTAPDERGVRLGLQPHAPYSAGPELVRAAMDTGLPVSTHLAETLAERELLARACGEFRTFLDSLGLWTEAVAKSFGNTTPIARTLDTIGGEPLLAAHVNDCTDEELDALAESNVRVAYCPRAHETFGHPAGIGPHRYQEMLDRGINVCLATDSIVSLPADSAHRISPLDDARLLVKRNSLDPLLALRMITTNGADALGLPRDLFRLHDATHDVAGLLALRADGIGDSPIACAFAGSGGITWLAR